jgi:hypothetical protein
VTVVANRFGPGVSGNRNTGVSHTTTELVAMLDDDALAHPGWLDSLVQAFADPAVIGAGGPSRPAWTLRRPSWFPDEFLWVVGCSYPSMPDELTPVRNVWSGNMAVRRDAFDAVGGFRVGFGKVGDRARPEDTDLCLRMSEVTGGRWMYAPGAQIDHTVPAHLATFRHFVRRCFNEAEGKIELGRLHRGRATLATEQDYIRRVIPTALARGLTDAVRARRAEPAIRSAVIAVAVMAAAAGLATGTARGLRRNPGP